MVDIRSAGLKWISCTGIKKSGDKTANRWPIHILKEYPVTVVVRKLNRRFYNNIRNIDCVYDTGILTSLDDISSTFYFRNEEDKLKFLLLYAD